VDSTDYAEACYRATTTLAFIAPDTVLPRLMEQIHADLSLNINQLTDLDIGVWGTPEGQTFIDGKFQKYIALSHSPESVDQFSLIKATKRRSKGKMQILLNGMQNYDSRWLRRKAQPH
jgi:hypothetical protein